MPQSSMDWWEIASFVLALIGVVVTFMRRPKKTTNSVVNGSGNQQSGGDGTTVNTVTKGDNNRQQG